LDWPNPEVPFFRNGDLRDMALTSIFVFVGRSCAVIGLGLEGIFMLVRVPRAVAMASSFFRDVVGRDIQDKKAIELSMAAP
jgi:hypothetical protein